MSNETRHSVSDSRARGTAGRRMRLLGSLLTSRSHVEAAARAGCSTRTLQRALKNPAFQADLQAAKDLQLESAINSLRGNANAFVETLTEIAADAKQHGNARVRASEVGLNALQRFIELEDIMRRVTRLEESISEGIR